MHPKGNFGALLLPRWFVAAFIISSVIFYAFAMYVEFFP